MKSILDAVHEGRLVELPEGGKEKALEYLAMLIEASPEVGKGQDIVADIKKREALSCTGLGAGVACPHVRAQNEGDLLCAIGWSPTGIDYGSPDGKKVSLVIMWLIPDSQRNIYLRELSGLAKVITETGAGELFSGVTDIHTLRDRLLDWVERSAPRAAPDAKARMIKLVSKHIPAAAAEGRMQRRSVTAFQVLVTGPGQFVVLANDPELAVCVEGAENLPGTLAAENDFELHGKIISVLSAVSYCGGKVLYNCAAVTPRQQ
jgi:mannitol/fructose-specific phosphotransferase system IIA component (Ntr-type)